MPTLHLKIDCDKELDQREIDQLRDIIAAHNYSLVLFDSEYSEETLIDWEEYMGNFHSMSA